MNQIEVLIGQHSLFFTMIVWPVVTSIFAFILRVLSDHPTTKIIADIIVSLGFDASKLSMSVRKLFEKNTDIEK